MGQRKGRRESKEARRHRVLKRGAGLHNDPNAAFRKDRVVEGQQRWHAIGAVEKLLLLVVHVYRKENEHGEEIIGIISARKANSRERRIYIQQAGE
jgi:uncharacterized DUF497 family protein